MDIKSFMRHSFLEGIDWELVEQHAIWEDYEALDRAFSCDGDDEDASPPSSPSARKALSGAPGAVANSCQSRIPCQSCLRCLKSLKNEGRVLKVSENLSYRPESRMACTAESRKVAAFGGRIQKIPRIANYRDVWPESLRFYGTCRNPLNWRYDRANYRDSAVLQLSAVRLMRIVFRKSKRTADVDFHNLPHAARIIS